ncbi:MAG: glutaredoxin [Saprospiraceae bacterium]
MKSTITIFTLFLITAAGFAQKQDVEVFEKKEGNKVIVMARNTGKVEYSVSVGITSKGMDVLPSSKVGGSIGPGLMKEMAYLTPRAGESWEYSYEVSITQSMGTNTINPAPTPTPAKTIQTSTTAREIKSTPSSTTTNKTTTSAPVRTKVADAPASTSNSSTTNTRTTTSSNASTPATPALSKADIIVYSKPGCSRCEYVKKQLTVSGIRFEEYSTASSSPEINNMWAAIRTAGFTGGSVTMPVVRANGKYYYNIPDMAGFVEKLK